MKVCRFRQSFPPLTNLIIRYCGVVHSHSAFVFTSIHMAAPQLPNYLRAHRKRLGLSQEEVSYLLGAKNAAKVCRYERFVRGSSLEAALACEAVFLRPASELFAGLYQKIAKEVAMRAKLLARRNARRKSNRRTLRKHDSLATIASAHSKKRIKQ
jgi:transcriptional regulator with XRE-family HTH domain